MVGLGVALIAFAATNSDTAADEDAEKLALIEAAVGAIAAW